MYKLPFNEPQAVKILGIIHTYYKQHFEGILGRKVPDNIIIGKLRTFPEAACHKGYFLILIESTPYAIKTPQGMIAFRDNVYVENSLKIDLRPLLHKFSASQLLVPADYNPDADEYGFVYEIHKINGRLQPAPVL